MNSTSTAEELIRLVKEGRIDLQSRDPRGRTVLHHAVRQGRVEVTEFLLEKGADINVADDEGETPLLAAAKVKKADELLPVLLKHGADITVRDICGENILHYLTRAPVEERRAVELARVILKKGASLEDRTRTLQHQPIHSAVQKGKSELVKLYLDYGANVNARAKDSEFPLYLAAAGRSRPAVLETLLERGANIGLKTIKGRTALHRACEEAAMSYNWECVRILLSAGADVLAEDEDDKTSFASIRHSLLHIDMNKVGVRTMLKALALKKFCLPPRTVMRDEKIITKYPEQCHYYQDCVKHIYKAKSTRVIETCSFMELLIKSDDEILALLQNPEFVANFRRYDLKVFGMYADDMQRVFEHANSVLRLKGAVDKLHRSSRVKRGLTRRILTCYLPTIYSYCSIDSAF